MDHMVRRVRRLTAGLMVTILAGGLLASTGGPAAGRGAPSTDPTLARESLSSQTQARRLQAGSFRVATFNVLGFSHTTHGERGRTGGRARMNYTVELLDRHAVDVVGFQELQAPQVQRLRLLTGDDWGLYPEFQLRERDSENSIGWRRSEFKLVHATTVNTPYFDGNPRAMPIVLLRHRASGMLTYFSNFHNPADTPRFGRQGPWRLEASRIQIALHWQLYKRGIPRIMTGDMNERKEYFCRVTRNGTPLQAARPGSVRGADGVCRPGRPPFVDWIFGSKWADFHNYFEANGELVKMTSDHPMIMSDVTVQPSRMPRGWQLTRPPEFVPRVSY